MARLSSIVTFALICVLANIAHAQESAPKQTAPTEAAPTETVPKKAPKKPTHKRAKKKKAGETPDTAPTGAIVVALGADAQPHARSLARAVYQDAVLRPRIDESTAQVLSGGAPPKGNAELERHASVIHALGTTADEEVQRRLAGSLARDLNARLIVLVSVKAGEPTARIVRMPEERMLAVKLTARKTVTEETSTWDWAEAASMMRELSIGAPLPGPRKKKKDAGGTATPTPEPEESEDDGNLLTSPWFWGGLGLVVTVGATVLILSQTALNEPDVVMIDGRVTP
jgi:hypothetical protein